MNARQELFCLEYVKDLNATQAAIRAGYSENSAQEQSSRLLSKVIIKQKIQELQNKRSESVQIDANMVLLELKRLATVDISQAFDEAGGIKPLREIPEDVRRAISGIEVAEMFDGSGDQKHAIGLIKKLKFWDKNKALEAIGRHLKLFTDKVEHSGSVSLEQLVAGEKKE